MADEPQNIREELAAVRGELAEASRKLSELMTRFSYMADHESRIRSLELAVARSAWVPVIVTAIFMTSLGAVVTLLIQRGLS